MAASFCDSNFDLFPEKPATSSSASSFIERLYTKSSKGSTTLSVKEVSTHDGASQSSCSTPSTEPASLEWEREDDPENPYNWPTSKKVYHSTMPSLYAFVVTFGSSVITPACTALMVQFQVSSTVSLLSFSLYILGLAFGPILAAPLSETRGRRFVYMISFPLFSLFTLGAGFSQNFHTLVICRFFAGLFGSPPLAVGAGTIADLFRAEQRTAASVAYILTPFLGPALGPVIGGFCVEHKSWRWTQWAILFFAVLVYLLSLGMQETYKKTLLLARAKKQRLALPPKPAPIESLKLLITVTLIRPIFMLGTEPIVAFLSLYVAIAFATLYSFFAAFQLVFAETYGFTIAQTGLTFLSIALGCVFATATVLLLDRCVYQPKLRRHASALLILPPEHRLYAALLASIGLPTGLFLFGWTARASVHWIVPVLSAVPFAWGCLCLFTSAALYMVDVYEALNGASALAANGLLRYAFGAAFPLFTVQMYERLGTAWATSLLAFLCVGLLPVPWVLFKFGDKVRARSAYRT